MSNQSLPSSAELLKAYSQGYFPMPDPETGEILWFRPALRAVLPLDKFHVSKSLMKDIRRGLFNVTLDQAFSQVMQCCAQRKEVWITDEFKRAYLELHWLGRAHSVEIWSKEGELIGGTYGVQLGGAFFAESKFHLRTNCSKIALYYLVEHLKKKGFGLLEIQFLTTHLATLGAKEVSDLQYEKLLYRALQLDVSF